MSHLPLKESTFGITQDSSPNVKELFELYKEVLQQVDKKETLVKALCEKLEVSEKQTSLYKGLYEEERDTTKSLRHRLNVVNQQQSHQRTQR